jgi:DNA or RNA helicases of superfamily II
VLITNWEDEFIKWGKSHLFPFVNIYCYQSLHKQDRSKPRNIIIDEGQWLTEANLPKLQALLAPGSKLIVLTATMPKSKKHLYAKLGIDKKNTISYALDQGVVDNLVADYRIIIIEFPLDNTHKIIQAGRKGAYFFVTEQEGYNQKTKNMKRSFIQGNGKFGMLQRLHYIYNLPSKLKIAQWLQSHLANFYPDKKTLFFCASIQQANAVCKHRYHSKVSIDDYKDFCEDKIMQLSAVKSIAAGVNIPDLDCAVIVQCEEQDLSTIQKIGRAARKSSDPNKKATIFVLKATGTQDEKWVNGALASFDKSKIDYVSFNQLLNKGLVNIF